MKSGKVNESFQIIKNTSGKPVRNRLLIGTATLGIIRLEWATARYGQVIPCNWTVAGIHAGYGSQFPVGYLVADAQNIIVDAAVSQNYEWVLLLEDDVIPPYDLFLQINNKYFKDVKVPIVSGLYFLKSNPPEPLVYRGRGNGAFFDWKMGDLVWADGVPTGCLLIHSSILKLMWDESPEYKTASGQTVRKVFETPAKSWEDPETGARLSAVGTSDLYWCDRIMKENVLQRAGWKKIGEQKYPFLVDTNMFCKHIDLSTGFQYPMNYEWKKGKNGNGRQQRRKG